ncbi:MAG: two-component system, NtrC family, nitrogen regulation sensor histidine kinase NtrY [Thermodesulfobacteriota bacterium]|nr:two-component system, NtrC family, nitrogen regulation sensor histidine kinase NtrY [Thermodesulfobacteriota bacterium]
MVSELNAEIEKRKRRRELLVASIAAVLIGVIFLIETQMAKSADDIPFAGHLLLFGLLSVVTLLLILMIFFLIRNLFKLFFERRRKILGSNLKTRLTLAFVALTLIPTVVLFIASAGVLHTTIESWFKAQVEESLQSSLVIAQTYYQYAAEKVLSSASRLANSIEGDKLVDASRRASLTSVMEEGRSTEGLTSIQIYFEDGSPPVLIRDPSLTEVTIPPPPPSFLKIGLGGNRTSQIIPLDGGSDLIRGIVPLSSIPSNSPKAVLVADYFIPTSIATRLLTVSNAFGDYQEAKRMRGPIKTIYILILLVVALLVIFIGFWFGMTMARDITDPILSLAEGTGKIASGDLDVYIDPVGDDELAILVRSFNRMAEDLRRGRDELVRVNLDLESRRKYMETILRNIAAGVLALDATQRVSTANDSARLILGIVEKDLVGREFEAVLPKQSAEMVRNALDELFAKRQDIVEQQVTVAFPKRVITLLCFAGRLRDEDRRDMGFVLVFEDITYLLKAQRMVAWREVARRIAHEIKNPLTPIQLNAQRIRKKYRERLHPDTEVLDRCTHTIIDQVEVLKNMVNEFSRFARMPSATPVLNDINRLVQEVVQFYSEGTESVEFRLELDPSMPVVAIDEEQMKRAVINLMDNAVAAVGEDGMVTVRTHFDQELSMAFVEVSDNGRGINPEDRDRLFEPYFSRRPGGTGLGLTIVSTIVSDHNGFVRLRENPERGVTFVIELPVRSQPA